MTLGPGDWHWPAEETGNPTSLPPILLAPVPEAAVWVTSSRKHALFLRKWKVSEVWWGAGCLQQQLSGLPFSYSPSGRSLTGTPGSPVCSLFPSLALTPGESGNVGRGCLSRCKRRTYHDLGLCRATRRDTWGGRGGGHGELPSSCVSTSLLHPQACQFSPFFLPLTGKKLTSGPLHCHSCSRCCSRDCPGWCDQRHSRSGRG